MEAGELAALERVAADAIEDAVRRIFGRVAETGPHVAVVPVAAAVVGRAVDDEPADVRRLQAPQDELRHVARADPRVGVTGRGRPRREAPDADGHHLEAVLLVVEA